MRTHIKDVFKANEEHVRLPEIYFCFELRPDFDYQLAQEIINEFQPGFYQYTKVISSL